MRESSDYAARLHNFKHAISPLGVHGPFEFYVRDGIPHWYSICGLFLPKLPTFSITIEELLTDPKACPKCLDDLLANIEAKLLKSIG